MIYALTLRGECEEGKEGEAKVCIHLPGVPHDVGKRENTFNRSPRSNGSEKHTVWGSRRSRPSGAGKPHLLLLHCPLFFLIFLCTSQDTVHCKKSSACFYVRSFKNLCINVFTCSNLAETLVSRLTASFLHCIAPHVSAHCEGLCLTTCRAADPHTLSSCGDQD